MEVQYQFFQEKNLLVQKYIGDFTEEQYTTHVNKVLENPEWKYVKKVLTDFRQVNLDLDLTNLDELIKLRNETVRKKLLVVFLVDEPNSTAIVHLYKDKLSKKYDYKYCSTMNLALGLLKLNETENEMEDILKNLKNKNVKKNGVQYGIIKH